jgi:hypothetical protein
MVQKLAVRGKLMADDRNLIKIEFATIFCTETQISDPGHKFCSRSNESLLHDIKVCSFEYRWTECVIISSTSQLTLFACEMSVKPESQNVFTAKRSDFGEDMEAGCSFSAKIFELCWPGSWTCLETVLKKVICKHKREQAKLYLKCWTNVGQNKQRFLKISVTEYVNDVTQTDLFCLLRSENFGISE